MGDLGLDSLDAVEVVMAVEEVRDVYSSTLPLQPLPAGVFNRYSRRRGR